ncbi:rhodanese-like domain-containing protein [Calidifontibacillus oryziterrae]|uniref:rhodanese-like domain-containing protein n=1 Tax=Calidifontibacillus oryziterrae TaxID=1191699 RepID=UPI0002E50865|nr:rhodanese-like domain-containing protein [Calidifontibacillus oryziterrae]
MEFLIALILTIIVIAIYYFGTSLYQKRYLKTLTEEDFKAGYRKAQIIDVREPSEFENGHILGARNIPLSQLYARKMEIRKDMPVYLYDQTGFRSARAAAICKKFGCKDISHLKGGFKQWTGKVKTGK